DAVAISFTLPDLALLMAVVGPSKKICTTPDRWSFIASPLPLYGTCTISMLASRLNFSPLRCEVEPEPNDAKLSLPGLAFANSTSSFTLLNGIETCAVRIVFDFAPAVIGVKSLNGSQGGTLNRCGFCTCVAMV